MKRSDFIKTLIAVPFIGSLLSRLEAKPKGIVEGEWMTMHNFKTGQTWEVRDDYDQRTNEWINWIRVESGVGRITYRHFPELDSYSIGIHEKIK